MGRVQSIGLSRCSVRSCHQGSLPGTVGHLGHLRKLLTVSTYSFSIRDLNDRLFPGVAMLAEKELATVGRMADGRLFVSRVDLLHAYVHALAIARQVKEYLGGSYY
jgi:hypothetical protein